MSLYKAGSLLLLVVVTISCSSPAPSGPTPVLNVPDTAAATASGETVTTSNSSQASPTTATVQFGLVEVGSGFPPPSGHDRSGHANDTLVPGTVVIDAGGTVTFNVPRPSPHQVSIYGPGKRPEDVNTSNLVAMPAGCPNNPAAGLGRIADTNLLVQAYTQPCGPPAAPITHTFPNPGRYLVICAFNPHFQIGMYGWVIVRERPKN